MKHTNFQLILFSFLFINISNCLAQNKSDKVFLKNGKTFDGKIISEKDSSILQFLTDDDITISLKKENIDSIRYAIIDTSGFHKAHYFNFKIGTKFISEVRANNIISKQEVEIIDIKGNEMKTKTTIYQYGATQQITTWSKVLYEPNRISYFLGSPEITFKDGSDQWFSYPIAPSIGTLLPDVKMEGKIYSEGLKFPFKGSYVNQKIISNEIITTPAGTFSCYLLSYTSKSKMLFVKIDVEAKCWISDQVGVVKLELYRKSGELQSQTILESIH